MVEPVVRFPVLVDFQPKYRSVDEVFPPQKVEDSDVLPVGNAVPHEEMEPANVAQHYCWMPEQPNTLVSVLQH